MDKLSGELRWPKEERSVWDIDPLSDLGVKLFLGRCDYRERRTEKEQWEAEKVAREVANEGAQCVLVRDRTVRNPTIKDTTHDVPGDATEPGLGLDEDGAITGGAERQEGPSASDYDGDADE
jgi:hypothetical protein